MEKFGFNKLGQWSLEKSLDSNKKNQLGITPEKGKIKFDPGFGQKEYREYVEQRADHMKDSGYAAGEPDDFNWHYEPEYDLSKLIPLKGSIENWITWFNTEMTEWKHDHGDAKKGHFEKWVKHPYVKPIIIIEGTDGKVHQLDGHHRAGIAFKHGRKTVPAIFGRYKNKE